MRKRIPVPTKEGIKEMLCPKTGAIICPLVVGHPLDYACGIDGYDLSKVYDDVAAGKVMLLDEEGVFKKLLEELEKSEPRLLSLFMVYDEVAKGKQVSDHAILVAIRDLEKVVEEEEKVLGWESDTTRKFKALIQKVKTANNKVIWFDRLIQEIHFDPDLLRHLDKITMLYLATLINTYFNILRYGSIEKVLKFMEDYDLVRNLKSYRG